MNIPGFTAQASLDIDYIGHDRGAAPRGHATDVVTPAMMCCSSCERACDRYGLNSNICKSCSGYCNDRC